MYRVLLLSLTLSFGFVEITTVLQKSMSVISMMMLIIFHIFVLNVLFILTLFFKKVVLSWLISSVLKHTVTRSSALISFIIIVSRRLTWHKLKTLLAIVGEITRTSKSLCPVSELTKYFQGSRPDIEIIKARAV